MMMEYMYVCIYIYIFYIYIKRYIYLRYVLNCGSNRRAETNVCCLESKYCICSKYSLLLN